jgi:CubicO group peptidase (beta-lactamase class C family)
MPRSARAGGSSRNATRLSAPGASPATSARADAAIRASMIHGESLPRQSRTWPVRRLARRRRRGFISDWDAAAPEAKGMRAGVVADTLKAGESLPGLRALLVAHRGVLVAERYYAGANAETLQPINSATKSVCSMLVGLALRDGRLKSLDDTVAQLLPEATADVPDSPAGPVTLRQILSGRSGLAFDPMHFGKLAGAKPLVSYVLGRQPFPWRFPDGPITTRWSR